MSAKATAWRLGAVTRRLVLLSAIVVAVSLAFTGAASAQPLFQASVKAVGKAPCSNGAFICGTASIDGYGPASFSWFLNSLTVTTNPTCYSYSAVAMFALSDGVSTLALNESGVVCGPGLSLVAQPPGPPANGHPIYGTGSWQETTATGVFSGLTGSTGTDALHAAGYSFFGTYAAA